MSTQKPTHPEPQIVSLPAHKPSAPGDANAFVPAGDIHFNEVDYTAYKDLKTNKLMIFGSVDCKDGTYWRMKPPLFLKEAEASEATKLANSSQGEFLRLSMSQATGLMQALWDAGVRPVTSSPMDVASHPMVVALNKELAGMKETMAATKLHLEDMRKIVAAYTDPELKK